MRVRCCCSCLPAASTDIPPALNSSNLQTFILGNINLAPGPAIPNSRVQRQLVVDGQQRIVTLLLLLAAAHEHVLQQDEDMALQIRQFLKQVLAVQSNGHCWRCMRACVSCC